MPNKKAVKTIRNTRKEPSYNTPPTIVTVDYDLCQGGWTCPVLGKHNGHITLTEERLGFRCRLYRSFVSSAFAVRFLELLSEELHPIRVDECVELRLETGAIIARLRFTNLPSVMTPDEEDLLIMMQHPNNTVEYPSGRLETAATILFYDAEEENSTVNNARVAVATANG